MAGKELEHLGNAGGEAVPKDLNADGKENERG